LAPEKYQVIWTYHHLLLDGWSLPLLLKDLFTCYEAFSRQQEPVLGQVRPYHDYLVWLQQQSMEEAEAFWRERLQGFMAPTKLKVESGVDNVSEVEPGYKKCILQLSEELTQRLQQLVRQRQLTLNTLIQGAWAVLLSRYSGEQDVVFGATVAGRPAEVPGIERMVGLFINTLPIRVKFSASQPVLNVLHRVQQDQLDVSRYEYSPLAQVQSWSNIPAGTALFESLLVFENYPVKSVLKEQSEQQQLDVQFNQTIEQTNYPLMLEVLPNTQLLFQLSYNRSHFSQATVERMLNHLQTILEYILVHPEHTVAEIPLLTQEERQQWLVEQNQTQVAYPLDESVAVQIAYHAQHHPTMTALVCGQTRMSYGQLQERATQLAHRLRKLGVGPDVLVGLYMPRSIEMVVGMLAIFQAGGAYLPLDLATPRERLEMVLNEAQPQVVLTHTHLRDQLPMSEASILTLHPSWQGLAQESTEPLLDEMDNQRLAYVIYTSGSTGRPKGVMVTHKGMLNHLYIKIDELSLTEYDRVAQTASHCFDISVWQIFASLLCGGQVHILPDEIAHDPENLAAVVEREGLTVLEVVPSFLRAIVEMHSSEKLVRQLRALRWLVVTGEALPADLCHRWCQMSPVSLVNAYGPTECSDDITHLMIEKAPERIAGVMPIGKALANTTLYILDKWLQPVPEGIAAELYIGGTGVGRGYLGDPVRTATAFVPHPFSQEPGERLYRTGDLARFLSDGTVEFVGRIDYQVKVRGFRIELGEIEAALQQLSMVQESVVLVREDVPGNQRIVAYIVCSTDEKPDTEDLKRALREKLPEYMVPSVFITLPTMPLTPNGKIDRRALPTPEEQDEARGAQADSARRPMEELLTMYWCDVLGLNHVGVHDNFFELGGQSLLAMRLISRIRAELQVEITLKHLFEAQTIAGLAEKIDQLMRAAQHVATPPLVPRADDEKLQLSFAQQRLWFIDQLEPGNAAYNIPLALQLDGKLNRDALAYSLQEIVRRHETLRTTFVVEDELPVQVIHPSDIFQMNSIDLEEMPFESHEEHIRQLARREAELPFDLTVGPLLRATLIRCNDQKHILLLTMHHIASDGWSMGVLLRDMSTIYRAYVNGKQPSLPMLPVQYADVARWERMWMQGDLLQSHLDYWRHQLSGYEVLQMPTDRPRSATPTSRGAAYQFELSRAVADALGVLNQQEGVTMFMTLLTVFQIILQRYCDQNDIVIGTDVAGRNRVEVENLIGFFVNQLVLRSDLSGEPTFRELLRHNRNMCMDAYVHQDIPFEKLVEELKPKRGQNMAPFFQVKFLLQNLPIGASQELPDITVRALAPEVTSTKLDIVLQITPSEDGLHGLFTYSTELFDESTMKRMAENFKVLVLSILAHPDAPISKLEMCTQEEREQQQREQQQREQAAIKKFKGIKPKAISVKRN
jgi:amino acid adenylation domain-containing protein